MPRENKPVGCLFPRCACAVGTLGCPHEPYDMKLSYREDDFAGISWHNHKFGTDEDYQADNYDESFGG